jgi:hypothetical protein
VPPRKPAAGKAPAAKGKPVPFGGKQAVPFGKKADPGKPGAAPTLKSKAKAKPKGKAS